MVVEVAPISFFDTTSAGSGSFTCSGGAPGAVTAGSIQFFDSSTAGSATITNNGGTAINTNLGVIKFALSSSGGNAIVVNNPGSALQAPPGFIIFQDNATAGAGTYTCNASTFAANQGAQINFSGTSTAGSATFIITNSILGGESSGTLYFGGDADGGTARVINNGIMDISALSAPGMTIGSVEGSVTSASLSLGHNNLTIGSNNRSTGFAGFIQDGGQAGGIRGSLTKIGTGILRLLGFNTYTGGTTVNAGTLLAVTRRHSATGTGPVQVSGGTLGGTGLITGIVTVGSGTSAATLIPGSVGRPGTLTIHNALTFNALATCQVELNSATSKAGKVVATGVTINSAAQISITDLGAETLTSGTVFTIVSDKAVTPIAGTFSNLADGTVLTVGSNTYQVSYEGGDGNDLTLTVQ
jgi:autotransporter-associated beta strand protein